MNKLVLTNSAVSLLIQNKFCDNEHILKIRSTIDNKFDDLKDTYKIYIFRYSIKKIKKEEREKISKVKTYKEESKEKSNVLSSILNTYQIKDAWQCLVGISQKMEGME